MRMNALGANTSTVVAPAVSLFQIILGRMKLNSRPPPAAALTLRKVRRERLASDTTPVPVFATLSRWSRSMVRLLSERGN
jgi:hypothetical protein